MNFIKRAQRALGLRPVVTPPVPVAHDPQADELPASVCRALEATRVYERPSADEKHPRVVVSVPGMAPFMPGDESTAEQLAKCFPALKGSQPEVAARFLKQALRERKRARRRAAGNWVTNY